MNEGRIHRRSLWMVSGAITVLVVTLSGCWSVHPERYVDFRPPIETSRDELSQAVPVKMEVPNDSGGTDELVATVPLSREALALYYVPRSDTNRVDISPRDLSQIVVIDANGTPLEIDGSDAIERFPEIYGFREADSGYDDPEEETLLQHPDRSLRWRFAFSVPDSTQPGDPPVEVDISVSGSEDDDTRAIFVAISEVSEPAGTEAIRFSLPRSVFGMKEQLDAEVQRLIRSVHHRDDVVFVFDRIVDLSDRTVRRIVTDVPGSFIDHISIAEDGSVAAIIFGTRRISKDAIVVPLED